jgi:hypothetical protein
MGAFLKARVIALRTIILSVALVYAVFAFLHFNWIWRNHISHFLGSLVLFASFPWSLLWIAGLEPSIHGALPGYAVTVVDILAIGLGAGINLAILVALTWFFGIRVWSRRSST